jgi:hypothetical protein
VISPAAGRSGAPENALDVDPISTRRAHDRPVALAFDLRNYVVKLVGGEAPPCYVVVIDGTEHGRFPTRAAAEAAFRSLRRAAPKRT